VTKNFIVADYEDTVLYPDDVVRKSQEKETDLPTTAAVIVEALPGEICGKNPNLIYVYYSKIIPLFYGRLEH